MKDEYPYTTMIRNELLAAVEKIKPQDTFPAEFRAGAEWLKEEVIKKIKELNK